MTGYIFQFNGHGAFSPEGKVSEPMTTEQIQEHNRKLAAAELAAMRETGVALLYLFRDEVGNYSVGTWDSAPFQRANVLRMTRSRNNWGVRRTDVWFRCDGATWHGVNLGDNDIVRCRRNKS